MFTRLAAGLLAGASLSVLAIPAQAGTNSPVRWNSGGAVWTTTSNDFETFLSTGETNLDRALDQGIDRSGWSSDEIQQGMTKTYDVDVIDVTRFLYSDDGVVFLKNQTKSYFPYWKMTATAVQGLRAAIIADSADGSISSQGIMANLPVAFRLADTCGTFDGSQNVWADGKCQGDAQCTSLLSWYVFLPACVQANQLAPRWIYGGKTTGQTSSNDLSSYPMSSPIRGLW